MVSTSAVLRVLCIDDDADFVQLLSRQLNSRGFAVLHSFDAIQGYRMAVAERPDLIITDYCMPYKYGTYLLRQLREDPELSRIPVIVISGRDIHGNPRHDDDPLQAELLRELGAENVLRKPLNWQSLFDAIEANTASTPVATANGAAITVVPTDEAAAERAPDSAAPGAKIVLVVDDDKQACRAIEKQFQRSGFHVITAASGEEALTLAHQYRPDAITLDVRLPDMDGVEVAQRLHDDVRTLRIPIIFVTAKVDRHFHETTRSVGGRYFLRKPFDPDLLTRAVNDVTGVPAMLARTAMCPN